MKPKTRLAGLAFLLGALALASCATQVPAQETDGAPALLSEQQIDDLVAPIALYPDALLAQILPASTEPLQIVQAARFVDRNKGLSGDALRKAVDQQPWDPSVKALVPFPDVLSMMNEKLDWTQSLGEAFVNQQADVMDSIQTLRARAQAAGSLRSTEQQKLVGEGDDLIIQPADPDVVYVPLYDPRTVYDRTVWPGYTGGTLLVTNLVYFATGVAVGRWWDYHDGWCDWDRHDVYTYGYYGGYGYRRGRHRFDSIHRPPPWRPRYHRTGRYDRPGYGPPSWHDGPGRRPPSWGGYSQFTGRSTRPEWRPYRPSTHRVIRPEWRGYATRPGQAYRRTWRLPAGRGWNEFGAFGGYHRGRTVYRYSTRGWHSRRSPIYAHSFRSGGFGFSYGHGGYRGGGVRSGGSVYRGGGGFRGGGGGHRR